MTVEPTKIQTSTNSIPEQITKGVRNRLIGAIAAGLVAGVVAAVLAIWGYLQAYVGQIGLVPRNSVVAFMGDCPSQGWEQFSEGIGKFIVGAGPNGRLDPKSFGASTGVSVQLTSYKLADQGGEEQRTLSEEFLPKHSHSISTIFDQNPPKDLHDGFGGSGAPYGLSPVYDEKAPTKAGWSKSIFDHFMSSYGGDKNGNTAPLVNLPPYVALNWCKRTG